MSGRGTSGSAAAVLCALLSACQGDWGRPAPLPALDEPFFRCQVQPVLTATCGMFACHGDGRRFFRVFGRNRLRLSDDEVLRNAPLSEAERGHNLTAALAMIDPGPKSREESLLLKKPLEMSSGGYFHRGAEIFGRGNVFADRNDADYQVLLAWVRGATEDPRCKEPGSDL